jgi:RNA polymerase primary sigma factor
MTAPIPPSDDLADVARRLLGLDDREKLILRLRFGLDGSYRHTLDDVAAGLGMSRETVREIEATMLAKLR